MHSLSVYAVCAIMLGGALGGCVSNDFGPSGILDSPSKFGKEAPEVPSVLTARNPSEPPPPPGVCEPTEFDPAGDFDGDGVPNQAEVFWGMDPRDAFSIDKVTLDSELLILGIIPVPDEDADRDGDGLPNLAELCITATDPADPSTDGDAYPDGVEFFGAGFGFDGEWMTMPANVPRDVFNPAVAHVELAISRAEVDVPTSYVERRTDTKTTRTSLETFRTETRTHNTFAGATFSTSHTYSGPPGTDDLGDPTGGYEYEVKAEFEAGYRFEHSHQIGLDKRRLEEANDAFEKVTEKDFSAVTVRANLGIRNIGTDLLRGGLTEVSVNFFLGSKLLATWASDGAATYTNLHPGQAVTFGNVEIPLGYEDYREFLRGVPVTAKVDHFSYGEEQLRSEEARSRVAEITVDKGGGGVRVFRVLLRGETSLGKATERIGLLVNSSTRGGFGIIESVDGLSVKVAGGKAHYWAFSVERNDGQGGSIPAILTDLTVRPTDRVLLQYVTDSDGDLIPDIHESKFASDPSKADTDGDGLLDGEEVTGLRFSDAFKANPHPIQLKPKDPAAPRLPSLPWMKDSDLDGEEDPVDKSPMQPLWAGVGQEIYTGNPQTQKCKIFGRDDPTSHTGWRQVREFDCPLRYGWGLATGDIDGDGKDELVTVTAARNGHFDYPEGKRPKLDLTCHIFDVNRYTQVKRTMPCGTIVGSHGNRDASNFDAANQVPFAIGDFIQDPAGKAEIVAANYHTGHCQYFREGEGLVADIGCAFRSRGTIVGIPTAGNDILVSAMDDRNRANHPRYECRFFQMGKQAVVEIDRWVTCANHNDNADRHVYASGDVYGDGFPYELFDVDIPAGTCVTGHSSGHSETDTMKCDPSVIGHLGFDAGNDFDVAFIELDPAIPGHELVLGQRLNGTCWIHTVGARASTTYVQGTRLHVIDGCLPGSDGGLAVGDLV